MLVLVQHMFFYYVVNKRFLDIDRRMSAKDWSEWRWAFSFYGVETWLLLCAMRGTKRLIHFSDYTRAVKYFRSARVYLLLLFMRKIQGKGKTNLHCS